MRKVNAILAFSILVLFVVHGIFGGFQVMGVLPGGNTFLTVLAWIMMGLIAVHLCLSLKLTGDTLHALKMAGKSYFRENHLFWARRISGLAVLLFVIFHIMIFLGQGSGTSYRLSYFGTLQLVSQILLVASVAVHVLCNIRPLFIAFGAGRKGGSYLKDILLILAIILLFTGAALIIYYLRWNVFWRYG